MRREGGREPVFAVGGGDTRWWMETRWDWPSWPGETLIKQTKSTRSIIVCLNNWMRSTAAKVTCFNERFSAKSYFICYTNVLLLGKLGWFSNCYFLSDKTVSDCLIEWAQGFPGQSEINEKFPTWTISISVTSCPPRTQDNYVLFVVSYSKSCFYLNINK